MSGAPKILLILVIAGAFNWLFVGLFDLNPVAALFGESSVLTRVIYVLFGLAGQYCITLLFLPAGQAAAPVDRASVPVDAVNSSNAPAGLHTTARGKAA